MITGIGTDIIEIERIGEAVKNNERFLSKFFTAAEIAYFESRKFKMETIAGRFAAKEAVAKALGKGFSGFDFKDIEIISNDLGKPEVQLHGKALQIAEVAAGVNYNLCLSISHNKTNAIAFATLERP